MSRMMQMTKMTAEVGDQERAVSMRFKGWIAMEMVL